MWVFEILKNKDQSGLDSGYSQGAHLDMFTSSNLQYQADSPSEDESPWFAKDPTEKSIAIGWWFHISDTWET